jgi:hypothetical membrane protein
MSASFKFKQWPACLNACGALVVFLLVVSLARLGLPEYSHWSHPVALRGANGLPGAVFFNVGMFLLPGLWLLLTAQGLRKHLLATGWASRIGLTLCQLSALAFTLQGVLSLDASGENEAATRLHALVWMLWWLAFVPGGLLLAFSLRHQTPGFALGTAGMALLLPVLTVLAPIGLWVGMAQRLAYVVWLIWWCWAEWALNRTLVSSPKSSPPIQT